MAIQNQNEICLVCDFETTVYAGQTDTQVWASACVEMWTENVVIFHSIGDTFDYFKKLKCNLLCYYHNLKFDGSFWLDYLLTQLKFKQAYEQLDHDNPNTIQWLRDKDMPNNSFKYSISDKGMWYTITIKTSGQFIRIRDSLKLLPFSVKRIGQSFKTKHKKLDMKYDGFRYPGCEITPEEKDYIANDVLVVKEALEIMYSEGHDKLTIGSCCLSEYKKILSQDDLMKRPNEIYNEMFPNLYDIKIDKDTYGSETAGDYIRKSYKGGWCYLVRGKENTIYHNGITADVNSLYPSVMSSESGCFYPTGKPRFWSGNYIPEDAEKPHRYFFVRIRTRFFLKPDKLPFIQIKNNLHYRPTQMLETSDIYNAKTQKYYSGYYDTEGERHEAFVELTLTMTDWYLLNEHYNLVGLEILDGCIFYSRIGIFDHYISHYAEMKMNSTGARRELAKLFLNNLYGKMASSPDSSFKVAFIKEDGGIGFFQVEQHDKIPGYIAVGSAITSYARNFTIRTAQKNYHGKNAPGFIYADTDSIHCDLKSTYLVDVPVHPSKFCNWKLEATWDEAIFVRQKTYIEHVVEENLEPIEKPFYNIKCAGMPEKCKRLFLESMGVEEKKEGEDYTDDDLEFIGKKRGLSDFKVGIRVPGKLMPKRIRGGILLVEGFYEMR